MRFLEREMPYGPLFSFSQRAERHPAPVCHGPVLGALPGLAAALTVRGAWRRQGARLFQAGQHPPVVFERVG